MPAVLALSAALVWGVADFLGGAYSRRLHTAAVMLVSQAFGLASLAVVLAAGGWHAPGGYLWWGALGSLAGTAAGALFYRGLALGTMSIVAPIAATGLVVPVAVGLASGERPSALQLAGIALAAIGVVLASGPELRVVGAQRTAVLYAAGAACGFGVALTLIPHGARVSVAMTTTSVTLTGAVMTGGYVLLRRPPMRTASRDLTGVGAIGLLNVAAILLYGAATNSGLVAVAAVLGSLYPVVTVLLAHRVYGERLQGVQLAGVVAALVGVVCLGAG